MMKREENEDERFAKAWLIRQGYRDIRRPCSDPPDFVIDSDYAVEVTRLNQRIPVGDDKHSRGEEEARKPLRDHLEEILGELGPPGNEGRSWGIDCEYDFTDPLPSRKIVTAQISEALAPLLKPYDDSVISGMHSRHLDYSKHAGEISYLEFPHLCLGCGICLELGESSHYPAKFFLQNVSDGKGIGIAEELKKGIRNRIRDKSETIRSQNKAEAYKDWWLVLVDHVCHVPMRILSEQELSFVRDQPFDFWSRIVVISSKSLDWHYDLIVNSPGGPADIERSRTAKTDPDLEEVTYGEEADARRS